MMSYRVIFDVSCCINVFFIVKLIIFNLIDMFYDVIECGVCWEKYDFIVIIKMCLLLNNILNCGKVMVFF